MRHYTEAERDAAVIRAAETDDATAAAELGIPRRTVSSWRHRPAQAQVILASREQLVDRYREAESLALERVISGLQNKRTPVHHAARALEALASQRALLSGQATANNFNVTATLDPLASLPDDERIALRKWLDMIIGLPDSEIAAHAAEIMAEIRESEGGPPAHG